MKQDARILLVGFGNMGRALANGWLARGRPPDTIHVADPAPDALDAARRLGLRAGADPAAAWRGARVGAVVLAVKPAQVVEAARRCRPAEGGEDAVYLSIAAGKTLAQLSEALGETAAAVRAMPNTPAAIGRGMTVLVAGGRVTPAQRALCDELMSAVGAVAWLDDERLMDAVTAISGCGPAYLFLFIECLRNAAVELGLDPALAARLAHVTVTGASAYADASDEDVERLRRRVTSPGGSTQAALDVLMSEDGLARLVERAARAAAARSRELSAD